MSQTVIGIFQNTNEAQEAKAYLLANGFNSESVDISGTGSSAHAGTTGNEEGFGDKVSGFFKNIFENEDDASSHIEAAKNGVTVNRAHERRRRNPASGKDTGQFWCC